MDAILVERLQFLSASLSAALLLSLFAWKLGYYSYPASYFKGPPSVHLADVVSIFALFLGIELILVPSLAWGFFSIKAGHLIRDVATIKIDLVTQGWLNLMAITASFIGIIIYLFFQSAAKRKLIIWGENAPDVNSALQDFGLGVLTWFLSYPIVLVTSQLIAIATFFIGQPTQIDQVAVKHLKMTIGTPLLFFCTAAIIIAVVPITEEILFRGFLQRWLVKNMGRGAGILLSAVLFAGFHFSLSQQWENIELILSLFILACFLGFLYERQGSLWAPIGLHVTFNAISVFFITWGEISK